MKRLVLLGCALWLPLLAQADSLDALDAAVLQEDSAPVARQKSTLLTPEAFPVRLEPLTAQKKQSTEALSEAPELPGVPVQVGMRRDIPQLDSQSLTAEAFDWIPTANGGHVAAISITSPQAVGLRVGLYVTNLPTSATLRFYAQEAKVPLEIHATEVLQTLANNLAAGDRSEQARYFWSPPIAGEEITLEIELPAGTSTDQVQIKIPALSHLFRDPAANLEKTTAKGIGDAGSCNINYQCVATEAPSLDMQSRAVAKMSFVMKGNSYNCTGTLLNNTNQDKTPYFLTARHCIPTQTEASTLVTYWLYRAKSCFSTQLDSENSTLTGGAQLLYTNTAQDTTFLKLNKPAPSNAVFAGWNTEFTLYNKNQGIYGLHNPAGDMQKVSAGTVTDFVSCTDIKCGPSSQTDANAIEVVWDAGVTEGGSSGSALFTNAQVIAQLFGGAASCSNKFAPDQYSLLAPAYAAGIKFWLSPETASVGDRTVVEYYNPELDHYFITAEPAEQASVDSGAVGRWVRTGQSFKAGGATAACRFFGNTAVNPKTGIIYGPNSHFYTVDQTGCNELISIFKADAPSWKFESNDFLSTRPDTAGNCPTGTQPVHRLYNNGFPKGKDSNHRFVTDLNLINAMTVEGWLHEGVDMCAPL
ncbi:MAG: hypothetical protein V4812_03495 [Pseudomonadota bacterium]